MALRILKSLVGRDDFREISSPDFLFLSRDREKQDVIGEKKYDRFLDPILHEFRELGYSCAVLALPFALETGRRCLNFNHRCNRFFFL